LIYSTGVLFETDSFDGQGYTTIGMIKTDDMSLIGNPFVLTYNDNTFFT